jgi:hypothetical protein
VEVGGSQFKTGPSKKYKILSEKLTEAKRAGVVTHVVEHLKHKAPSSNPSTIHKYFDELN